MHSKMNSSDIQVGIKVRCIYPDPSCYGWTGIISMTHRKLGRLIRFSVEWDSNTPYENNLSIYTKIWYGSGAEHFENLGKDKVKCEENLSAT